jgi:MFS family permease
MKSAIRLLPMIFMMVTGSIGGGLLLSKIGYYTPFYIVGSGLGIIASAVLFRTTTDTSDTVIYLFTALTGLGTGISAQVAFSVAQVKVPKDQVGQAIAFLSTGQLMGVVVSLAICGTCMLNTAISGLASVLPDLSPQVIESVVAGTAGNTLQSLPPDLRDAALEVIVSSINKVYIVTLSAASVGLICSLCLKHERIFPGSGREEKSES